MVSALKKLFQVKNDIMTSTDQSKAVILALLDMSAALDRVDHDVLFDTQLYLDPGSKADVSSSLKNLKQCIADIQLWIIKNVF